MAKLQDEIVLHLIVTGKLVVTHMDHPAPQIWKEQRPNASTPAHCRRITPQTGNGRQNTRLAVHLALGSSRGERRRTKIMLSRLVWMAGHKQVIPPDHEIHHIDNNPFNNALSNLLLLSREDHAELHYEQDRAEFI